MYLGVYDLEETYESLHRAFTDDADAYDARRGGVSACAGVLIDGNGRLVAGSAVLSSALWAVGRLHDPGPMDPSWKDGFDDAARALTEAAAVSEERRQEIAETVSPPPHDAASLLALLALAQTAAGITEHAGLATGRVLIDSVAVKKDRAESPEHDFLNSFYLDDLAMLRDRACAGDAESALGAYLTGDGALDASRRVDVVHDPEVTRARTSIARLPKGRWPANPAHSLALSQQFAVNAALNDLAPNRGLMGVNGPPGTGKTTMLRDILAGNVVERARRLSRYEHASDAFEDTWHHWKSEGRHARIVRQLKPELTGFEMVVASANNAAVENVTTEIPAVGAIDGLWRDRAGYFREIATEVLRETTDTGGAAGGEAPAAWGMVAARLGRKGHRSSFRSAYWFDPSHPVTGKPIEGGVPRMHTWLTRRRGGTPRGQIWARARGDFAAAESRVDALIEERRYAEERLGRLPELTERVDAMAESAVLTREELARVDSDLTGQLPAEQQAEADRAEAAERYGLRIGVKPGVLETIFTLGRAVRRWRAELEPYAAALREAEARHQEAAATSARLRDTRQELDDRLSATERDLARDGDALAVLKDQCKRDERRYGDAYPGPRWTGPQRELNAPWLDAELDTARSELFLAALGLHEAFIAAAGSDMLEGLRAAIDVVGAQHPPGLEAEKLLAAWQVFFLAVPLVSTTFASAGRMFGGLGHEAIGWLLIDEAGQAAPQYAAGSIWRARRVLAVGDPLQLQPVVTIPQKAQLDIAASYEVPATWLPPRASAQTLADRVATYGTTLPQGEDEVWISAPLRVHRRCDEPMFGLCNAIAYDHIMVNGVYRPNGGGPDRFDGDDTSGPLIAASHWAHEPATVTGTHLQPTQIVRLERALDYLRDRGVEMTEIIAISPFRAMADRLAALASERPGLRAGSIHTAQGREAPVVILVLGGDPAAPGAKSWAASAPNLVNVAASRAQRRLYVIGDRHEWERYRYFRELSAVLD